MTAMRLDVTSMRSDVAVMSDRLARLEAGQERQEGRLERLEAGQVRLETSFIRVRADLMERIDWLQHTVDLVKDVNYGASDRTERIAKGASDETRAPGEIVRAMQRQIKQLQSDVEQLRDGHASQ